MILGLRMPPHRRAASGRLSRAHKQLRRRKIAPLEAATDIAEGSLQYRQDPARELIHEKCAARFKRSAALADDVGAHAFRHAAERNSRDDVAGQGQSEPPQHGLHLGGRIVHDVQPWIRQRRRQEPHERAIGLNGDQMGIAVHAAQYLAGDGPDAGSILHDDSSPLPVDWLEYLIYQKARAWNDRAEHVGGANEVAGEQQHFPPPGPGLVICHGESHTSKDSYIQLLHAGASPVGAMKTWRPPAASRCLPQARNARSQRSAARALNDLKGFMRSMLRAESW